jgi:hypothetical protein
MSPLVAVPRKPKLGLLLRYLDTRPLALKQAVMVRHYLEMIDRDLVSHGGVLHSFEATAGPRFRKKNFLVLQPLQTSPTSTNRFHPRSRSRSRATRLNETLYFGSLCPSVRD